MHSSGSPFSIAYIPLLIKLKCSQEARLPAFLGSTLHGIVGWALSRQKEVYHYLFENRQLGGGKQDIVNPYIIEPPAAKTRYLPGDELVFKLILLGNAARYTTQVVQVLAATSSFGLGAERKVFHLSGIWQADRYQCLWEDGTKGAKTLQLETLAFVQPVNPVKWCSVQLVTPLRIRRGGELVREITFSTILRSITRRVEALAERYDGNVQKEVIPLLLEQAAEVEMKSADFYLQELNRYSNRRSEQMDMTGILGAMTFQGDLNPFIPWLQAAKVLHIGRNVTFGFGQVEVALGK